MTRPAFHCQPCGLDLYSRTCPNCRADVDDPNEGDFGKCECGAPKRKTPYDPKPICAPCHIIDAMQRAQMQVSWDAPQPHNPRVAAALVGAA